MSFTITMPPRRDRFTGEPDESIRTAGIRQPIAFIRRDGARRSYSMAMRPAKAGEDCANFHGVRHRECRAPEVRISKFVAGARH